MGPGDRRGDRRFFSVERLIADYPKQLEYDLRVHCRLDLRDLWRDGGGASNMTHRLVAVLFDGLPGECLTKTAIRDKLTDEELAELAKKDRQGHGPWSRTNLQLAEIRDYLAILARGMRVTGDFQPVPRPGVAAKKKRRIGPAQLEHLRRLAAEHEAQYGDTSGRGLVLPFAPRSDSGTG